MLKGWHIVAAVLYVLSINHKHMLVYFAPAFFSYMLGCCLRKPPRQSAPTGLCTRDAPAQWRSLPQAAAAVAALGATVIAAMLVVWAPFLAHQGLALKVAPPHLWHSSFMHALLALMPPSRLCPSTCLWSSCGTWVCARACKMQGSTEVYRSRRLGIVWWTAVCGAEVSEAMGAAAGAAAARACAPWPL